VSRAADSKAKLTVALDGARARRRPQNRQRSTVGGGGAPCTCGQSEREGERVGQRAQMREERWASRAQTWPENVWSWARPRWGDRGREVEDELTGGDGRTEREWARGGGGKNGADSSGPRDNDRDGERGHAGETG
jgi:hypothetical protein